ncbi:MAG: PQQ-dependent sugar dehydrogenase [Verrucomicrobiota bacterium]
MKFYSFMFLLLMLAAVNSARGNHQFIRNANTTLQMPQNPQSAVPSYTLTDSLNGLVFDKPVGFAVAPGETNRLFVVERFGRIIVITNLANPTRTVFLDITNKVYADYDMAYVEGLSSVAFHPGYATNRFFYVTYTLRTNIGGVWQNYNRLARFQTASTDPNFGSPKSELPLITQFDEGPGHNMNDLKFGPDNYLYCASGDEGDGGTGDDYNNAQRIDKDFFSAILRIDVDKQPGNLPPNSHPAATTNYAIPADNPFIGPTSFNGSAVNPANVRTEFYAVGFRNCWRIAFDPATGRLYEGDVGQHGREEINVIVKGGNYGWAYREGTLTGPKGVAPPAATLINPIVEYGTGYGTNQGFSVIGGVVYRGQRIPDLYGAYVFADYVSGNIWMLRYDGTNTTPITRLTGKAGIAGFGTDPRNGDVLLADLETGKIWRLDYTNSSTGNIPLTLADTGAFSDLATLSAHPGIIPYDLNVPFWSDNGTKRRWFSLPNTNFVFGFNAESNWNFPATTVWIKHFGLEMTNGMPQSERRIETRFLVRNQTGVYGLTYRWGNSTTNAVLVPDSGTDESFLINDGGTIRTQVWHYPGRNECLACHTPVAGYALGFNTPQLNRDFNYGIVTNQIYALNDAGYFNSDVTNLQTLPALVSATNSNISREYRVRSYLAANCVQCHQPGGAAQSYWDARITTPLSQANILNGALFNNMGNTNNAVIKPGSLNQSMLLTRISNFGSAHMPPLATTVLNSEAINLVSAWITNDLPGYQTFAQWQLFYFGSTNSPNAAAQADPDGDRSSNYLEYLVGRNPTNGADGWIVEGRKNGTAIELSFFQKANRGFEVQGTTNLNAPVSWKVLDSFENRPFFSSIDRTNVIQEPLTNEFRKFYRVRVFEP